MKEKENDCLTVFIAFISIVSLILVFTPLWPWGLGIVIGIWMYRMQRPDRTKS